MGSHYYFIIILLNLSSLFNIFKSNNSSFKNNIICLSNFLKKIKLTINTATNIVTHRIIY